MNISCCAWALSEPEPRALKQLAQLDFAHLDVQTHTYATAQSQATIEALNMQICCIGLSFNMPEGAALDSPSADARQRAIAHIERGLDQAAQSGADTAYVVPGEDPNQLVHFGESMLQAADLAAEQQVALGIEHFPGKALPTAVGTLDYIRQLNHGNLFLLIDSGHLQLSGEDPTAVIDQAGDRLGYVHLDDNDGQDDLHWALCDGVLTRTALRALLVALANSPYAGPVSLELHPQLADPVKSISQSLSLVRETIGEMT